MTEKKITGLPRLIIWISCIVFPWLLIAIGIASLT